MNVYSNGMKGAAVVIHQMFLVLMVCCLYGCGYVMQKQIPGMGYLNVLTVVGLVGSFVTLAYLTGIAGRRAEDDKTIYLGTIDRIFTDVQLVLSVFSAYLTGYMARGLKEMDFAFSGLLVAAGTLGYLLDSVFLLFYLSLVRRSKDNSVWHHSLLFLGYRFCRN